jgi:hypothetical protein
VGCGVLILGKLEFVDEMLFFARQKRKKSLSLSLVSALTNHHSLTRSLQRRKEDKTHITTFLSLNVFLFVRVSRF